MSPENTHEHIIKKYIGGFNIRGVNTLYMLFCFFSPYNIIKDSWHTCVT